MHKFISLLFVLTIFNGQVFSQKPVYTFTFKVYVNEATASYYGGRTAVENLIKAQFANVNQIYNQESRFTGTYKFVPSVFSYFTENGPNLDKLNSIANQSPEASYNYRILYTHIPYNPGGHPNILADYQVITRSIRFALNAEAEWEQTLFGEIPTRILSHELGHARGASDLYASNVSGTNNSVNEVGYTYPTASIMNYLYNLSAGWDTHSIASINSSGASILTPTTWKTLFWSLFPSSMSIQVKNGQGVAMANTKVTIYGSRWLSSALSASDASVYYTDAQGKVTFNLTNTASNPFKTNDIFPLYSNLMVVAGTQTHSPAWITVFDVQNAKINGSTQYLFNMVLYGSSPTVSITSPANNTNYTAPGNINISANAADSDGSITKVDFYNGTTLIGSDATYPYSYAWTNVTTGSYTITARATDNAGLVTTSAPVNVVVNSTSSNSICVEAESASGQSSFPQYQVKSDVNASGELYIVAPNGTGNQSSPPNHTIANLSFTVPAQNTYHIWLRVQSPTTSDNDLYIRVDNNSFSSHTAGNYSSWTWHRWTSKSLTAGYHTLSIAKKEDGLKIDKILLTTSSATPIGSGCATAREEEFQADILETLSNQFIVAPNPTTGEVLLSLSVINNANVKIEIFNSFGTSYDVITLGALQQGEHKFQHDVSHLPAGMYFVRFTLNNEVYTKSLIKK